MMNQIVSRALRIILCVFLLISANAAAFADVLLGGVGTGSLLLREDGRWDRITINNNPHHPINAPAGCAAAVYVKSASASQAKWLHIGERGVESVSLSGGFPLAKARYADGGLPVGVELNAFTPYVSGDLDESSIPALTLRYRVQNPTLAPIEVAIAVRWQNGIGIGGAAQAISLSGTCKHEAFQSGGLLGVGMGFESKDKVEPAQQNALGEYTLAAIEQDGAEVSIAPLVSTTNMDALLDDFSQDGVLSRGEAETAEVEAQSEHRPAAVVSMKQTIAPGEAKDYVFVFAWRMPHWNLLNGDERGVDYAKRWKSSQKAAEAAEGRWQRWLETIEAWQQQYYSSSLPEAFVSRLLNGVGLLAASTVHFDNNAMGLLGQDPKYPGQLASPEELLAAAPMLALEFPALLKDQLLRLADGQLSDGEAPSAAGSVLSGLDSNDAPGGFLGRASSASAFVLAGFYAYLETGDEDYLKDMVPNLRAAIVWLAKQAEDGGVPRGPVLLGNASRHATSLENIDLYLGALRIGEELGQWAGDLEFQSICRKTYRQIAQRAIQQLWNGEFFLNEFDVNSQTQAPTVQPGALPGTGFLQSIGWNLPLGDERIVSRWRGFADQSSGSVLPRSWAPGLDVASMILAGYPNAALQAVNVKSHIQNGWDVLNDASLWWAQSAFTGAGYDPHNERFIVGPSMVGGAAEANALLQSGGYTFMLDAARPPETGQTTARLRVQSVPRKARLKQIAFRPPAMGDPDAAVLRVLLNGKPAVGQDFTSGRSRVFEFSYPRALKKDDELICVYASNQGGRVRVDLAAKVAVNFGAYCDIEPINSSAGNAAFRVRNRLRSPQIIFLEMQGGGDALQTAALDGARIAGLAESGLAVPVLLQTSPLTLDDQDWLRRAQWACAQSTRRIVPLESIARELGSQLWDLQKRIDEAVSLDAQERGFLLEIGPADSFASEGDQKEKRSRTSLLDVIERARKEEASFLQDVLRRCPDPVVSALIVGDFAPLTISAKASPAPPQAAPFTVSVETRFPVKGDLDFRVALDPPQQWQVESTGPLAPDEAAMQQGRHRVEFSVAPAEDLWMRRRLLPAVITGLWNGMPLRRELQLPVGHDFIKQWMTVGPFSDARGEAFSALLPPEVDIDVTETYKVPKGEIAWAENTFDNGFINFASAYGGDSGAAYAYVSVYSARELPARLEFGGAGDVKVFLNYKEMFSQRRYFQPRPAADIHYFKLFQGWNHFLVKISKRDGPWGFYFELSDIDGKPIPDLQFALDKA
ncbi:MAG: GH116 family glycosyl-hydrolase [Candidatus Hinthialibacter antarcticus]|nr:GH116 family glycosyl-hydrolase [Candidatus Hinthialibacter antarcticus]